MKTISKQQSILVLNDAFLPKNLYLRCIYSKLIYGAIDNITKIPI